MCTRRPIAITLVVVAAVVACAGISMAAVGHWHGDCAGKILVASGVVCAVVMCWPGAVGIWALVVDAHPRLFVMRAAWFGLYMLYGMVTLGLIFGVIVGGCVGRTLCIAGGTMLLLLILIGMAAIACKLAE